MSGKENVIPKCPDADSINADYNRINGLVGEAYAIYRNHRKRLSVLMKERDAVLAQWRLYSQMSEASSALAAALTGKAPEVEKSDD